MARRRRRRKARRRARAAVPPVQLEMRPPSEARRWAECTQAQQAGAHQAAEALGYSLNTDAAGDLWLSPMYRPVRFVGTFPELRDVMAYLAARRGQRGRELLAYYARRRRCAESRR